jgi:hypothetical protein
MAPAAASDPYTQLLLALQQRQIPPLPAPVAPVPVAPPSPAFGVAPPTDALSLLNVILGNPQFRQTLQLAAGGGAMAPRSVPLLLPVPAAPQQLQPTQIPLGAVMNAIAALAGRSMTELNAATREDDPEVPPYLVDEHGEFVVDPASAEDRAALVTHLFRLSEQAQAESLHYAGETFADATPFDELDEHDEQDEHAENAELD